MNWLRRIFLRLFGLLDPPAMGGDRESQLLAFLLSTPRASGAQMARATGLGSGALYSMLYKFEEGGWVTSEWGDEPGYPRRRLYDLTENGKLAANYFVHAGETPCDSSVKRNGVI